MRVSDDNRPPRGELLAAIEVCRERRAMSLIGHLPGFADFDCEAGLLNGGTPQRVEVEFFSRPSQGAEPVWRSSRTSRRR